MNTNVKAALVLLLTGFLSFFTAIAQSPPANISSEIDALFQAHVNQTVGLVPGHVIRIEKPNEWVYENASGLAALTPPVTITSDMKFKIASITKLFTTVATFKLIQEGKVNFNAPIGTYLPLSMIQGFADYQNIRVKNLISHTSGINDPQSDFQGRLNYWIYMKRFEDIPLDSLLFWSYDRPFGLGNYYYSNSNFYLLAEIIKTVSGISYQQFITNNIINPLGLTNTDFNTTPTGTFMRGYLKGSFYPVGGVINGGLQSDSLYDFTTASNSWGYGAADLWSNCSDLIKFHKALFTGQLINSNWVDTMKRVVTNTGDMGSYGYGMMHFKSFNAGPIYGIGHTGTAFGYGTMLCYIPSLNVYMCSAGNYMKIGQEFLQRDIYGVLNKNLTSLEQSDISDRFNVFPNPASKEVYIQTQSKNYEVTLCDFSGRIIINQKNTGSISLAGLIPGIYLIKINDINSNKAIIQKFIKE